MYNEYLPVLEGTPKPGVEKRGNIDHGATVPHEVWSKLFAPLPRTFTLREALMRVPRYVGGCTVHSRLSQGC